MWSVPYTNPSYIQWYRGHQWPGNDVGHNSSGSVHVLGLTTLAVHIQWSFVQAEEQKCADYNSLQCATASPLYPLLEIILLWEDMFQTVNNSLPKSTLPSCLVISFSLSTCDEFIRENTNPFYKASLPALSVCLLLNLPLTYKSGTRWSLSFGLWFGLFHVYAIL